MEETATWFPKLIRYIKLSGAVYQGQPFSLTELFNEASVAGSFCTTWMCLKLSKICCIRKAMSPDNACFPEILSTAEVSGRSQALDPLRPFNTLSTLTAGDKMPWRGRGWGVMSHFKWCYKGKLCPGWFICQSHILTAVYSDHAKKGEKKIFRTKNVLIRHCPKCFYLCILEEGIRWEGCQEPPYPHLDVFCFS